MRPVQSPARLFQSILCPVDFSTHSRIALQHAMAIAHRTGGRLTAMYADDPMLAAAVGAGYDHERAGRCALDWGGTVQDARCSGARGVGDRRLYCAVAVVVPAGVPALRSAGPAFERPRKRRSHDAVNLISRSAAHKSVYRGCLTHVGTAGHRQTSRGRRVRGGRAPFSL